MARAAVFAADAHDLAQHRGAGCAAETAGAVTRRALGARSHLGAVPYPGAYGCAARSHLPRDGGVRVSSQNGFTAKNAGSQRAMQPAVPICQLSRSSL